MLTATIVVLALWLSFVWLVDLDGMRRRTFSKGEAKSSNPRRCD